MEDIKGITEETNVVVIGDIQPPLTPEELEILSCDPKYCLEDKVGLDKISIAMEEGKVKDYGVNCIVEKMRRTMMTLL